MVRNVLVRSIVLGIFSFVVVSCGGDHAETPPVASGPDASVANLETKTSALLPSYEEDDDFATAPSSTGSTGTSSQNLQLLAMFAEISSLAGAAKSIAGYISAIAGGISAAETLLALVGLLHPDDEVKDLTADLNAIGLGLSVQIATAYVNQNYSLVGSALDALTDEPSTVYAGSLADSNSSQGVLALESSSAWYRAAIGQTNDSATDGPIMSYPTYLGYFPSSTKTWKNIVPGRNMVSGSTSVFDWRLGAAGLMNAIDGRMLILNQIDPNFTMDHQFDQEIGQQYSALLNYYQTMVGGIQCASQNFIYFQDIYGQYPNIGAPAAYAGAGATQQTTVYGCNIVCADVNTGIASLSSLIPPQPSYYESAWPNATYSVNPGDVHFATDTSTQCANVSNTSGYAHAQSTSMQFVESKMPIFEMRSEIDVLYRILHPGPDLTQTYQQFEPQTAFQRLCVDFVGESATQGTQLQLLPCNGGNSQWWVYNRQTGQIQNPPTGLCMDVQWANPLPGALVWGWPCTQPQGTPAQINNPAQEWTYDPLQMHLQNAAGTVLTASGLWEPSSGALLDTSGVISSTNFGAPIWYNMQAWHTDLPTDPFP